MKKTSNRRDFVKTFAAATAVTSISKLVDVERIPDIESAGNESLNKLDNPFTQAAVVWKIGALKTGGLRPVPLKISGTEGKMQLGKRLDRTEYLESLKHGGEGIVAVFNNEGWLSIDTELE
jgi:hypothetical protein